MHPRENPRHRLESKLISERDPLLKGNSATRLWIDRAAFANTALEPRVPAAATIPTTTIPTRYHLDSRATGYNPADPFAPDVRS